MSNTKWRKILSTIVESEIAICCVEIKIIGNTWINTTLKGFSQWDIGEIRLNDGSHGPLEYKWIEWMRFPRKIRTREGIGHFKLQDIEQLKEVIEESASVSLEIDEDYLVIFGYKGRINTESMPDSGWA